MIKKIRNIDLLSLLILLILVGIVIYGIILQFGTFVGISPSTKERTPIVSEMQADETLYEIAPEWTSNTAYIEAILPAFAESTGVIPYLKVLAPGEVTDSEELASMADSLYQDLIQDENHFLFLYAPQSDGSYLSAYKIGTSAATVLDEEAITIFYQYLEKFLKNPECENADLFLRTYRSTSERIMGTESSPVVYTIILCVIVVLLIFVMVKRAIKIFKRAREQA